ncbi:HEAT repeat domain-containing protein [Maledivibacter halophilus]|uniref:HEAT repeat-containing protein n=1 Tax=Maledivibacter halophilus TaxID=36842 RepID=A0A1T5L3L2_9FIRM|nr:HEAT repeat domain-containing protein [Maledivibacter halophilus]SKC70523.1 HEAT repeat-containing protein [Maledivibacter halophilus]
MGFLKISWNNVDKYDDCIITYLLYKEGKTIEVISKIRNCPEEKIEKDIIEAKIKLRSIKLAKNEKKLLDRILELSKEERLKFMKKSSDEKINMLIEEVKKSYKCIQNPEDKASLIWLVGELKEDSLIGLIGKDILHKNGNVRRMVCSALGKIGNEEAISILHKALGDHKPQVRQYAAKALKDIGNENSLKILNEIVNKSFEKDYVKRACLETIKNINIKLRK